MPYVVTERCQGCRNTECVEVCPCDCFHRLDELQMLVINPDPCIDCGACAAACPVQAIYPDEELPGVYQGFAALNATRWSEGENVTCGLPPLSGKTLDDVKAHELERGYGTVADP